MAGAKVPLTFRIFKGDQLLREERLTLSVIKLGKVPSAHLKLDDETVSRMHAIIEVDGANNVSIIDLGSTKGTFVNGQKVNKAKLQSGDTIVVGETRIELAIGGEEETEEPTRVNTAAAPAADVIASAPPPRPAPPAAPMQSALSGSRPGSGQVPAIPAAAPPSFAAPPSAPVAAPPSFGGSNFAAPAAPALRPPPGMAPAAPMYGTAMAPPAGFQQSMAESVDDLGGARAVEVAVMKGDSVVGVKHCIDPRGGKVSGLTLVILLMSIAMLGLSVFSFNQGIDGAVDYKVRLDFAQKHGKPGWSVRPTPISPAFDFLALGGLALSVASLTWGIARVRREKEDPNCKVGVVTSNDPYAVPTIARWIAVPAGAVVAILMGSYVGTGSAFASLALCFLPDLIQGARKFIGRERRVDFAIEGAPSPEHPLVSTNGNDFTLNLWPGCEAEMIQGGTSTQLPPTSQPIPQGAKIRVKTGSAMFLVQAVPQPRRYANPVFAAVEMAVVLCFAGSLVFHLGFVLLLSFIPVEDSSTNIDLATLEDTNVKASSTTNDDQNPEKEEEKQEDSADKSGGSGKAMALDEGQMGKQDSTRTEGQFNMKKNADSPQLARQQAMDAARNAGVLGSEALQNGGVFNALLGQGDVSSGFDESDVMGGLNGNEVGEAQGGFGFGRKGFGAGGGGDGLGTIGLGRFGTIGHGAGTGNGYGIGNGRGGMRGHATTVPTVSVGTPSATGDLDKAIIRRYIKQNINKIQYCYEKALLADANLQGTVTVSFFISGDGTVQQSGGSGMGGDVPGCVAGVIKGIAFPKPKGGGGVQVNYPFDFRRSGGG